MNEPVRHHLVPRCYLKKFSLNRKREWYIHAINKKISNENIFNPNISNVCVETDFYTFKKLPPDQKRFLERYYSNTVEAEYTEIYDTLINPSKHRLSDNFRFKVISFIICQHFRTSKLTNVFNKTWDQILERGFSMINPEMEERKIFFEDDSFIDFADKTLKEVQVESQNENKEYINVQNYLRFKDLAVRRESDHIGVYKLFNTHKLITSDNPVCVQGHIYDPSTIIKMPIDNNHLVMLIPKHLMPDMDNKIVNRQTMQEDISHVEMAFNNMWQIEESQQFVLGNKAILEKALTDHKTFNVEDFKNRADAITNSIGNQLSAIDKLKKHGLI